MAVSYNTRRARITAGAGAIIAAGALAAGFAGQPAEGYADGVVPTYDEVASNGAEADAAYSDAGAPTDDNGGQLGEADEQGSDQPQDEQAAADQVGAQAAPDQSGQAARTDAGSACLALSVPGSYDTSAAQALLDRVNEIRAEAAAEGLTDYMTGEAVTGAPLSWSTGLEHAAQVRAAEASLDFSHERPDGTGDVLGSGGPFASEGTVVEAENLAQSSDAASALELWYAEKDAYERYLSGDTSLSEADFGHYAALIGDAYSFIGLGAFTDASGATDLAAELSATDSSSDAVQPDGECNVQVDVLTTSLTAAITTPQDWDGSLTAGDTLQLGATFTGAQGTYETTSPLVWTSDDESVATVDDDGLVSAEGAGSATISVSTADGSAALATLNLTVDAAQVSVPDVGDMALEDARDTLEAAGLSVETVTDDEASDPSLNGIVHDQSPAADTLVDAGTQVTLTAYSDYVAPEATGFDALDAVETEAGTAPDLPETVTVHWTNGESTQEPVTWDAVDPAEYAEEGSFTVEGTVGDTGLTANVTVNVKAKPAPVIASLEDPEPLTTFVGHEPALPATVKATWDNGDVTDEAVTWQPLLGLTQDGKGTWNFPRDFTLTGTVEGTDLMASIAVTVVQPGVQSVGTLDDVTTRAGVAPELPETVDVTWEDGTVTQETVDWDDIDPRNYAQAGSLTATGTVSAADNAQVSVHVTVTAAPTIASVAPVGSITTPSGTAPSLPSQADVTWSDGSTGTGTITWDAVSEASYKAREGGEFPVHGTLTATLGTGDDATADTVDVSVTVTVTPASATGVEQPSGVTTRAKTAPTLPATARVTWSNGDVTDETVSWDALDAALYAKAGTFTANGRIAATGQSVTCAVTVEGPTAVSAKTADATTVAGIAPQLPASVDVTWDDGTVTQEAVVWDTVSHDSYAQAGAFDVAGTIPNATGVTAVAHVSVTAASAVRAVVENSVVTTAAGQAPTLPATAKVTWSNGSVTDEAVSWNAVDAASYAQAGTFDVQGTVAGLTVTAHVNVTAAEVVKTADPSPSPALAAMLASGGILAVIVGAVLRLQAKRK